MLVVFGANGRTGVEIVKEAVARGIPCRPVVRDDRDARNLAGVVDVNAIAYADADHPPAIPYVLEGATAVIIALEPRTAGYGAPTYTKDCAANVLRAATDAGIPQVVHLSAVGAFRWSPHAINREAFRVDREVRVLRDLPWSMFRVSCYHDEVLEGHVNPPDGGLPNRCLTSSRYSPMHRKDCARIILDTLQHIEVIRSYYIGGPEILTGDELEELCARFREKPAARLGQRRGRTKYPTLPPGDVCVMPEHTRVAVRHMPTIRLADYLADPDGEFPRELDVAPVYQQARAEGPHPADMGQNRKPLREMGEDLRWVVHDQLMVDLDRLGHTADGVTLDFGDARARKNREPESAHKGLMVEMTGVKALAADGELLHRGAIRFLRDELAEEFRVWWDEGEGVPAHVLTAALYERFSSRERAEFADKLLSAMRFEFGGHHEK